MFFCVNALWHFSDSLEKARLVVSALGKFSEYLAGVDKYRDRQSRPTTTAQPLPILCLKAMKLRALSVVAKSSFCLFVTASVAI